MKQKDIHDTLLLSQSVLEKIYDTWNMIKWHKLEVGEKDQGKKKKKKQGQREKLEPQMRLGTLTVEFCTPAKTGPQTLLWISGEKPSKFWDSEYS